MSKSETDTTKIKITHTMADGSERDSIEGYEIPYNKDTAILYDIIAQWTLEKTKIESKSV